MLAVKFTLSQNSMSSQPAMGEGGHAGTQAAPPGDRGRTEVSGWKMEKGT